MVPTSALVRAALLGFGTGIRSMTPPAAVSWAASSKRMPLPATLPFSLLAQRWITTFLFLAAAGEYFVDKLPFTPPRTARGPLMGRIAVGGLVGASACAAEDESIAFGIITGGVAAAAGAHVGQGLRSRLTDAGMPAVPVAIMGDLLAVALAVPAVLQRGSRVR